MKDASLSRSWKVKHYAEQFELPLMEYVYQIWYETKVGPVFSSEDKAIAFLAKREDVSIEEVKKGLKSGWNGHGYPCIDKIKLNNEKYLQDR